MIFRNKNVTADKSGLFVDDMLDANEKPISKESLEKYPIPQKGKVISGTFGVFNIKDFEKTVGRFKNV